MEDDTWIKLYRKLLKSPIFENEKALKVWIWCLLKATHKDRNQLVGLQIVRLKNGQFVFGRKKASEELKMKESTIYKYISLLKKLQMIDVKSNNKFSVVSIEKWENYQTSQIESNNKGTTKEQQSNTNKNVKNVKNNKKEINKEKEIYEEIEKFTKDEKLLKSILEFIEYRKEQNKELTILGLQKMLNKFKKWKYTEEECVETLNNSIINGWIGVFELQNRKPKTQIYDYKEIDTTNMSQEEYMKLVRGEKDV